MRGLPPAPPPAPPANKVKAAPQKTAPEVNAPEEKPAKYSYEPAGRRDPFVPLILTKKAPNQADEPLTPLQMFELGQLRLMAVIIGKGAPTAMVLAPDGKGYSIRRGTRVGPNNGVVSSITDRGIIVQERFTDVYGNKQEREYVKLLHAKEGIE